MPHLKRSAATGHLLHGHTGHLVHDCGVAPCTCPGGLGSRYRIKDYVDGAFWGRLQYDSGAGCANCDQADTVSHWDGTYPNFTATCITQGWFIDTGQFMGTDASNEVQMEDSSRIFLDTSASPVCYWTVAVKWDPPCAGSTQLVFRKANGNSPSGIYTLDVTSSTAGIIACYTGPTSITIEAY